MRVGVMDLGSSSFRPDVAEAGPSGRIRHLVRKREDARRAGVIAAGAIVLPSLVAMLRVPGLTVSEWGVREGIILEAVGLVPDREPAVA